MGFLNQLLMVPVERQEGDFKTYIDKLESGGFRDKMFYGIAEDKRGFLTLDPVQQPGALYCGGMGSGKSIAMRSTLITHMAANSDNTIYILVDALKGMTDYALLFEYTKNVATALGDTAKLIPVIEMIYKECMLRKDEFSKVQAPNIYEYEKIIRKQGNPNYKLARIVLAIEEFHSVPNADVIKYHMNVDRNGSAAAMLKDLLRVGRSYGITLLAATQRATSDDFPSSLKPGITQLMAFRVNNPGDATAINLPLAADIRMEQRGRCVYEGGFIQFPYIDDETGAAILKKYYKPLEAELMSYKLEDYHQAFSGEGNTGMVKVKTFKSLIENFNSFKVEDIVSRLLEAFDFEVQPQTNKAMPVNLIAKRAGTKYAVMILQGRAGGSKKAVENFKEGMKILDCQSMIAVCIDGMIPSEVAVAKKEVNGYDLDQEDLQRIASILDHKDQLKKEGKFDQLFAKLPLVPLKGEIEQPAAIAGPKSMKSDVDDLFSQFQTLVEPSKPALKTLSEPESPKEKKTESVFAPSVEAKNEVEVKPVVKIEEPVLESRPMVATGGGKQLLDLKDRLKASLKGKI